MHALQLNFMSACPPPPSVRATRAHLLSRARQLGRACICILAMTAPPTATDDCSARSLRRRLECSGEHLSPTKTKRGSMPKSMQSGADGRDIPGFARPGNVSGTMARTGVANTGCAREGAPPGAIV